MTAALERWLRLASLGLVALFGILAPSRVEAFPSARVIDASRALSAPWLDFPLPGPAIQVKVTVSNATATCDALHPCASPGGAVHLYVHVFGESSGEQVAPLVCQSAWCTGTFTMLAGDYRMAVMVHGGPNADGLQNATVTVQHVGGGGLIGEGTVWLHGNIMVELTAPPILGYDLNTVLVPDGPEFAADGTVLSPGNLGNDLLGVAATELWVLGNDGRIVRADLKTRGVGAASLVSITPHDPEYWNAKWALARPRAPIASFSFPQTLPREPEVYGSGEDVPVVLQPGRMRLILNDWQDPLHDADEDRVSDGVEAFFGTCDGVVTHRGTWACVTRAAFLASPSGMAAMDPRDTDGDGISDHAEIFGTDVAHARPLTANGGCGTTPVNGEWQEEVGQTFPLWDFSPTHKDMLVEIDTRMLPQLFESMGVTRELGCEEVPSGCRGGVPLQPGSIRHFGELGPPMDPPGSGFRHPLQVYEDHLAGFWRKFALLPANRVNNPDGRDGIRVHFDVGGPIVQTIGHDLAPDFTVTSTMLSLASPAVAVSRPGVIVYLEPSHRDSSQCTCRAADMCPSPRHAGYAHYLLADDAGGGGSAGCNGTVSCGLDGGTACAHETGHHLGLDHGGVVSDACGGWLNPFGRSRQEAPDLFREFKINYISEMAYSYGNNNDWTMPFSAGDRTFYSLPRQDGAGVWRFFEDGPFGFSPTTRVQQHLAVTYESNFTVGPAAGCAMTDSCFGVDFDRDGTFDDAPSFDVGSPIYFHGKHDIVKAAGYWCGVESRLSGVGADRCCPSGALERCDPALRRRHGGCRGRPGELPTSSSMLLAASPTATVANGRLYGFFVDDVGPSTVDQDRNHLDQGQTLPRHCVQANQSAGTCMTGPLMGRIRWAAVDGFAAPADPTVPIERCLFDMSNVGEDCGVFLSPERGDVTVGGSPVANLTGTTRLTAATMRQNSSGGPLTETVLLAWTTRSGFLCPPRTNECRDAWGAVQVRFANGATMESGGFEVRGPATLQFPAEAGTHFSGVAAVAWNPADNGNPSRFLVFARAALGADLSATGRLYYGLCDETGCNQTMQPLMLADGFGGFYHAASRTDIAAAVDNPVAGTNPTASLIYGFAGASDADHLSVPRLLRVLSSGGAPSFAAPRPVRRLADPAPPMGGSALDFEVPVDSALSIAFSSAASGGRLMVAFETVAGDTPEVAEALDESGAGFLSTTQSPYATPGEVRLSRFAAPGWDVVRPSFVVTDASGVRQWRRADAPGHIPGLVFDPRAGIASPASGERSMAVLEGRVRSFRTSQQQGGPELSINAIHDPDVLVPEFDYDNVATMAFNLCQTIANSSRGTKGAGADIARFSPASLGGRPLACPGAASWTRSNAGGMHLAQSIRSFCSGACLHTAPPQRLFDMIADFVVNEGQSSRPAPVTALVGAQPTPPRRSRPVCTTGRATLADSSAVVRSQ